MGTRAAPLATAAVPGCRPGLAACLLLATFWLTPSLTSRGDPVPVRYSEGSLHGYLILRSATDSVLAQGDLLQTPLDSTIESRLILRFRDSSLHMETTTFSQHRVFQLAAYHLVQRGPAFPSDLDATLEGEGDYHVISVSHKDRKRRVYSGHLHLPSDVSNGLPIVLAKNLRRDDTATVHVVAFTPKPRLIRLQIAVAGEGTLQNGGHEEPVLAFRLKPEIGGVTGLLARLLGKLPADSYAWIAADEVPAFLQFQGPLFTGPTWRLSLTIPAFSRPPAAFHLDDARDGLVEPAASLQPVRGRW